MDSISSIYGIFGVVAFPCLICSEDSTVIYKNKAAAKYLPGVRRGAKLSRRLFAPHAINDLLALERPICISVYEASFYNRALGFTIRCEDKQNLVFLFFSRLQLPDGQEVADLACEKLSSDFSSFYSALKESEYNTDSFNKVPGRLYEEMISRICFEFGEMTQICTCDIADFLLHVRNKAAHSISVLGYRLLFSPTEKFLTNRCAMLDISDFSFYFFRALYTILAQSTGKIAEIKADFDEIDASIVIRIQTESMGENNPDILPSDLIPECSVEDTFLLPVIGQQNQFAFERKNRILTAKCRIPMILQSTSTVLHASLSAPSYYAADRMAEEIFALLKNEKK